VPSCYSPILNGHSPIAQQNVAIKLPKVSETDGESAGLIKLVLSPNGRAIWDDINKHRKSTAAQIAERTGLDKSTVLKYMRESFEDAILKEPLPGTERKSRPTLLFSPAPGFTVEAAKPMASLGSVDSTEEENQGEGNVPEMLLVPIIAEDEHAERKIQKKVSSGSHSNDNSQRIAAYIDESKGTTVKEITQNLNLTMGVVQAYVSKQVKKNRITRILNESNRITEYIYFSPTITDEEIAAALERYRILASSSVVVKASDDTVAESNRDLVENSVAHPMNSESPESSSTVSPSSEAKIWTVVKTMAEKLAELERRFNRLEERLNSGENVDVEEILAILHSNQH
jgi:DNA-binding MarR family transcriptional regulator